MKIRHSPGSATAVLMCTGLGRLILLRNHQIVLSRLR
jgi:hypothetical protein